MDGRLNSCTLEAAKEEQVSMARRVKVVFIANLRLPLYADFHAFDRQRATADFHSPNSRSRIPGSIRGSKRRSARQKLSISSTLFQKPQARPARYAAPSAVVSMSTGRTIGRPRISAWNCIRKLLTAAPP